MKTYRIQTKLGTSAIHVGETLENLDQYLPSGQSIIITDENIQNLYQDRFPDFPVITIGTGEKIKTLETVKDILRQFIDLSVDRSSFVVGIGGGIVCDITGFAASTYMRGLKFGFVSTTLLSQVDASVGGKNGVNLDAYKNMVGCFNQPEFVICDINLLNTLPPSEISNGMAEVVKHALIQDAALFEFLENNQKNALDLDWDTIFRLVSDSVRIKSTVVQKDEKETGERRKLNFGHTIGHAIEKIDGTPHGRAVSMGMAAAVHFSLAKGSISQPDVQRIESLLTGLNLPITLDYDTDALIAAALKDKKREKDDIFYILLEKIGTACIEKMSVARMRQLIASIAPAGRE